MITIYIIAGLCLFLFVIFLIVGFTTKQEYLISRNIFIKAPIEQVWSAVTDIIRQIEWRKDIQKIEIKDNDNSNMVWVEIPHKGSPITQKVTTFDENRLFETTIVPSSIYQGSRKIDFSHSQAGTTLRLTESISIKNPLKRPLSKMAKKLEERMNIYQIDLKNYLEKED